MTLDKILIVDDEPEALENCRRMLAGPEYECLTEVDPQRALDAIEREHPKVVLTDLRMPGLDGIGFLKAAKGIDPTIKVVLLTAYASIQTAVVSMRCGAFDYLAKPFTGKELRTVVRRALGEESDEAPASEPPAHASDDNAADEPALAGESAAIQAVRAMIDRVAGTDAAVLLSGERGTGIERIARVIHAASLRRAKRFVPVDCLASDEAWVERELFGGDVQSPHGSGGRAWGLLESAHGGTLFLDEVWGLSLRLQAKVLRVLKERRARRATGAFYQVDTRIIAASSQNLQRACLAGEFREDLYHYVNVVQITVPPLRQRPEDIDLLTRMLLQPLLERKHGLLPASFGFTPDALAQLRRHAWPGNIRELQRVAERAVVLADAPVIDSSFLPDSLTSL
jgi:DNA-binding NtrC family response regulator